MCVYVIIYNKLAPLAEAYTAKACLSRGRVFYILFSALTPIFRNIAKIRPFPLLGTYTLGKISVETIANIFICVVSKQMYANTHTNNKYIKIQFLLIDMQNSFQVYTLIPCVFDYGFSNSMCEHKY